MGGSSLRPYVTACLCLIVGALFVTASAQAAECTNTWIGPEAGEWQVAENWSAEHAPNSSDVACIPKEKTVQVTGGTRSAEVLQGEGRLTILAGSLALLGPETSHIKILHLSGGALKGPAELLVTETLNADGGSMEGAGKTVVGAEASGHVASFEEAEGPGLRLTEKRELDVKGALDVAGLGGQLNVIEAASLAVVNAGELAVKGPEGGIALSESADLVSSKDVTVAGPEGRIALNDKATLINNDSLTMEAASGGLFAYDETSVQNYGELRMEGSGGEIRLEGATLDNLEDLTIAATEGRIRGGKGAVIDNTGILTLNGEGTNVGLIDIEEGSIPKLNNDGTVRKSTGSETTTVEFKVDNESLVKSGSGVLAFSGGGNSGQEQQDFWVATPNEEAEEEPAIVFSEETFTLGEVAGLTGFIALEDAATVKSHRLEAEEAEVWTIDGEVELTGVGDESVVGYLIVSAGGLSLIKEGILVSEEAYLEDGALEIGESAVADVASLYQEGGATSIGDSASLKSKSVFIEAGSFAAGSEVELLVEGYFQEEEATATIGGGASLDIELTGVGGGSLDIGAGAEGSLGSYYQGSGSLDVGSGSEIDFGVITLESGALSMGDGMSAESSGTVVVDGSLLLGAEVSASLGDFVQQEGETALGSGTSVALEDSVFESGSLSNSGSITTDKFFWETVAIAGGGTIEVGELGFVNSGEEAVSIDEGRIVTHGFFSIGESTVIMGDGARLRNEAEFDASSEATGFGAQIHVAEGSTSNPRIVNEHEFNKESGTGTTEVTVPFENNGSIGQFTGTLRIKNRLGVPTPEVFGFRCYCADPVETASGDFTEGQTDFTIGGRGVGLALARTYSAYHAASATAPGAFGYGWSNSFGDRLLFEEEGERITLVRADGSTTPFVSDGEGGFVPPAWSEDTLSGDAEAGYTYVGVSQIERHFAPSGVLQSVTDRNGNQVTLGYTEAGKLKTITDPAERQLVYSYNEEGLVKAVEDPMGRVTEYAYEAEDLASVTMPGEEEPRWQFEYDPSHRMTKMVDGQGGETINEYDGSGRVISQTDPAGRTITFEYDGFHTRFTNEATGAVTDQWFNSNNEPTSITRGYGTEYATTEKFAYDETGRLLERTDGNGHATTYGYNPAGDRTSVTDAEENETKWAYNATHDVIAETTPNGETTTITRDENGNVEFVSRPAPGEAAQTESYEYDELGQLKNRTDPLERTWKYSYNSQGDLESEANPEGEVRTWAYNEDSEVIATTSPRGNEEGAEASEFTSAIERDAQGRLEELIDPLGNTTKFAYDANGNLESETDANGHTTEFVYNPVNEQIRTIRPSGAVLETGYDGAGHVVTQVDGNEETTTYVRDVLGQPVEVIDPLERKTVQEFDDAGNLVAVTDSAERVTTFSYDMADRLEEIAYSDESTPTASFEYDPDGNLTGMNDGSGETTYRYDQLGRLEGATNGNEDSVDYEYNLANEQERIVYPNGKGVDRTYDGAGRLESVTDWLEGTISFEYDADSNLKTIEFPSESEGVDEFAYDPNGLMISAVMARAEEPLAAIAYERDKVGQIEVMASEGLPGSAEEGYEYDKDDRLIAAGATEFEYDPADNPIETPGSSNSFDAASQLEAGTEMSYEYNSIGERIGAMPAGLPPTSYDYDQAGNLISVERTGEGELPAIEEAFNYDGLGLMSSHAVAESTRHLTWDMTGALPAVLDDDEYSYVYGPNGIPVERINAEETPAYLHRDQLGSTRMVTDGSGEPLATFTYDAFGSLAASTGETTISLGFASQYTLPQSGLQYLRARVYDPETAQFLSRDPLEATTRQPYVYALDDPLNLADPSGENPLVPAAAGAGATCAATAAVPGANAGTCGTAAALAAAAGLTAAGTIVVGSLVGDDEIVAGELTISKGLAARLAKEKESSEDDEDCSPKELKREGEELLGRGHKDAARKRWQEWHDGLTPKERKAYRKVRGPRPRSRN